MKPQDKVNNTPVIHEHTSDARTVPQVDRAVEAEGQALPTQGHSASNPVNDLVMPHRDFEQAIRADLLPASPNERNLLTEEDAAAKEQMKQFRRKVSRFGTSNGPIIDRYIESCRGWVKAINAAIREYYKQHLQNNALPQQTFIRIAREIFEPRVARLCSELLDILRAEPCLNQFSDRCDDVTRALDQFEQAWAPSSLISRQPQVFPTMKAVETALKRVELFRPILARLSPPMAFISAAVTEQRYHLSRKTLYRRIAERRLTDHREPGHATNAPLMLCENEIEQYWGKKHGQISSK